MSTPQVSNVNNRLPHGGLCHLMEAATALSKLVETTPPPAKEQRQASAVKSVISDDDDTRDKGTAGSYNKREIFPQRLMAILNDATLTDIVTWLPNGRSFVIVNTEVFVRQVLPQYLPGSAAKYPSFTRKLNRWGFRQITRGPDTGAFHHPLFLRDQPLLCLQMVCQRTPSRADMNRSSKSKPSVTSDENQVVTSPPPRTLRPTTANPWPTPGTTTAACVSSDETASTSTSSSMASLKSTVALFAVPIPPKAPPMAVTASVLSKDEAIIQDALQQCDQNERLRTAKAMLYHSYMQALGAATTSSSKS